MTEKTEVESQDLELSDPSALVTGKPLPMREHVFRTPDGAKVKVKLQGLSYAVKSAEDVRAQQEKATDEKKGIVSPDLRAPRLLAKAMRTPEGKRKFIQEEDEILFAVRLAEQMGDGEINRAYNVVMELSGYGKDALAEAGKD